MTCLKSGYGGEEFDFPDVERDQYFSVQLARRYEDGERQKEKEKAEEEKKKRRQMFKPRMINFPLFKNVSMDEAIQVKTRAQSPFLMVIFSFSKPLLVHRYSQTKRLGPLC